MVHTMIQEVQTEIEKVIYGKSAEIRLVLAAMAAQGHVLLEDVPGTGKTMLARALAKCFDCEFRRVQFTPDLLPSELTGIYFYSPKTGEFSFRKGSLFTNILLADEINRATPRTQSGLLESMEELQISVDGQTFVLPQPYFVIATQNPVETQGTFPLPEAQLDRFLIKLSLGYPSTSETESLIREQHGSGRLDAVKPVAGADELGRVCVKAQEVFIHGDVAAYIVALAEATRLREGVALGVSTRGCVAMARMARAYAAVCGKDFVTPDDVKYLAPYVFGHRLIFKAGRRADTAGNILQDILSSVPAPTEDWKAGRPGD